MVHLGTKVFHLDQVDVSIRVLKTLVDDIFDVPEGGMGMAISLWTKPTACSGLMFGVASTAALLDGILTFLLVFDLVS